MRFIIFFVGVIVGVLLEDANINGESRRQQRERWVEARRQAEAMAGGAL